MKSFEDWVVQARADFEAGGLSLGLASVVLALQALAAERAAEREAAAEDRKDEAIAGLLEWVVREYAEPRSISHWGIH